MIMINLILWAESEVKIILDKHILEHILNKVFNFDPNCDMIEYLRGISHNYEMN